MSLECSECNRVFGFKGNLTRHLRMVHNFAVERIDILPGEYDKYHYKCLEGCNISFKYNRELRKHLRVKHELNLVELNLEFPNSEEFNKWLHNEESNNYVQYVHLTSTKRRTTGTETYYLECSRTGKRSYVDDTVRKRRPRKSQTKLNRGCTSQIIVNKSHDGTYSVNYYKSHYGHELGLEHVKLSKQDRGAVASKLLLGLPISTVLHSVKNTSGNMKRINLLGRKDIVNIKKAFNIDVKDKNDSINVNLFLEECAGQEYNPVLYCNIQDFPEVEDICLVIMSEYQGEMLKAVGDNIIAISSVSLKNCDFELVTLFVIGKSWESFPAACMFATKTNFATYELFFTKIRERIGNVSPSVIFTNCDETYYEAWKCVMGDVSSDFYTPIQVEIDWKINLNLVVCDETEVTRIKRKWLQDTLITLQNNKDEGDFTENLDAMIKVLRNDEDFREFLEYFLRCYGNPRKWADCFKLDLELPLKQLEVLSDVLKEYLNEEVEVRFDKIFHSLVRFLRDETVNSMLNTGRNRAFFTEENDARHRLLAENTLTGNHVGDNLWNVSQDGVTYVVQRILEKKCCNLVCTTCHICLHCFSCSCVDFFAGSAICVHIHYIWVTYEQSIVQEEEVECDEEIIIEVDENPDQDEAEVLREAIVERSAVLCGKVAVMEKEELRVVLSTLEQLCELREVDGGGVESSMGDHSYL